MRDTAKAGVDMRPFATTFSEETIRVEKDRLSKVELFANYSSETLDSVLESRFTRAQQVTLARFLDIPSAEVSPRTSRSRWSCTRRCGNGSW